MGNIKQWIYEVIPEGSYPVIRNCPGCGKKTAFYNTSRFRVNAGGNRIDIWLIYHCGFCKHTLNLTIYERKPVKNIPPEKYQQFLDNDEALATAYGRDKRLFSQNKAIVDSDGMKYRIKLLDGNSNPGSENYIIIKNPWELKLRPDKLLAELLGLTRSSEKEMEKRGYIKVLQAGKTELSVIVRQPVDGQVPELTKMLARFGNF